MNGISALLDYYAIPYRDNVQRWQTIRCLSPDHDDRKASARVNIEEDAFACHGCGIKGDSIKVLMQIEKISRDRAEERYKKITGSSHKSVSNRTTERRRSLDLSGGGTRDYERGSGLLPNRDRPKPFSGS